MNHVVVLDCGGRGGVHRSWQAVPLPLDYYAFEPEEEEFKSLTSRTRQELPWGGRFNTVNAAVHERSGSCTLNIYDQADLSSTYTLRQENSYRYRQAKLMHSVSVMCTSIDDFSHLHQVKPHYIGIDAQGATLPILQGAGRVLREHVLGVRCEVEFTPLYDGQPLFDEVFQWMRGLGFKLLRLETCGAGFAGISSDMNEWSIDPGDAVPTSCDAIFVQPQTLAAVMAEGNADLLAAHVLFGIHNGCGWHAMEVLNATRNPAWIAGLNPTEQTTLKINVAAYLAIRRQNINVNFDAATAFRRLFAGGIEEYSGANLDNRPDVQKIRQIYACEGNTSTATRPLRA